MRRRAIMMATLAAPAVRAQALPLVFAAGAVKHAVEAVREAGHALAAEYDTVGALRDRVLAGERPDAVLLSGEAVALLAARGIADAAGAVPLGRTGVALAAPEGAWSPDISTPDLLRAALLAAPSIAQADPARGATAGRHFAALLERMGIAEAVRPKLRLVPFGVLGIEMAARGEVALAVSQATEIVGRPGVRLVGLLPDPLNIWTPYAAARVREGEAARALLALFASAPARAEFARIGFVGG